MTFKGKTLAQSIAINQKYNEAFRSELNDRHIKAFNELELIENYFNPKRKDVYKIEYNDGKKNSTLIIFGGFAGKNDNPDNLYEDKHKYNII